MTIRAAKFAMAYLDAVPVWSAVGALASVAAAARPSAAAHLAAGRALARAGRHRRALAHFEAASALAHASARRGEARWLHPAQFAAEHLRAQRGEGRVDDPLFRCTVTPVSRARQAGRERTVGRYALDVADNGFRLFGFVPRGVRQVAITLDGRTIRLQAAGGGGRVAEFSFTLRRSTLATFPPTSRLQVRADDGALLRTPAAGFGYDLRVPHGDGSLQRRLGDGGMLDKKGALPLGTSGLEQRTAAYLELYERARGTFERALGRPLFLMYGTLLGCWRDGALIAGDDDFDVGYVAEASDPLQVKQETFALIERLVEAGFWISFNRRGRLFRLADPAMAGRDTGSVHLDVRPLWFQDGSVWAHNHFTMPSERGDWLPFEHGQLGGTTVLLPRRTERFLEGHYGPGWRVPDPGFTYFRENTPESVWATLARALITPPEYRRLRARIEASRTGSGAVGGLRSDGWDDLYPLADGSQGGAAAPARSGGVDA